MFGPIRARVLVPIVFLVAVAGLCIAGRLPWVVLGTYGTFSAIAFGTYAYDKFSAKTGRWRTPERTLLTLGLFGGWPGALLAQQWLRHKSSKTSFQIVFWISVVANCIVLAWLVIQAPERIEALVRSIGSLAQSRE